MPNDPLLVHACCAPCLLGPLPDLQDSGRPFAVLFANPNIHPFIEFRRRLKAVKVLAEQERLELITDEEYGLTAFLGALDGCYARPDRCRVCYALRIERAADVAAERGLPAFTTTLLASPMQDREFVCARGREAASRHGLRFEAPDWRPLHQPGLERAKQRQLYRQQYCGCVFSEYDRYKNTTRHVYRPQTPADSRSAQHAAP